MKLMTGLHKGTSTVSLNGFDSNEQLANELNSFYMRFSNSDFSEKNSRMGDNLFSDCILDFDIDACEVKSLFKQTNVRKSPGPDHISGRVLKSCAGQLCEIFKVIFTLSLQTQIVPKSGNILQLFL